MMKIGTALTLEMRYSDKFEQFKCKLVETKDGVLFIDYPINMETNKTAFFLDGTVLRCSFVTDEGTAYMFDSEVIGRVKQNIPMVLLSYAGDENLIKIQRRQYVRVEASVDAAIHPIDSEFSPFVTVTDDISAGGVAILSPKKLNFTEGTSLQTWLVLPMQSGEYHYLNFLAKVIRVLPMNETRNKVSLQFNEVSPQERQILLRFCFDRQVAMKKKGLAQME